jgi:hypothetical protein
LLILGAGAVIRQAGRSAAPAGSWLAQMLLRKTKMLVTVALDAGLGRDRGERRIDHRAGDNL